MQRKTQTEVIDVEDPDRDLVFRVEVTYWEQGDGTVDLQSARPLSGFVRMPVITHREKRLRGEEVTEEFEFALPDTHSFVQRFQVDYEDDICAVLESQIADRIEACGRW